MNNKDKLLNREGDDQTPINVAGIEYIPIERISVLEFHELEDGQGEPTQVHLMLQIGEEEEGLPPFILRIKSRKTCDELITSLITHSKAVWP